MVRPAFRLITFCCRSSPVHRGPARNMPTPKHGRCLGFKVVACVFFFCFFFGGGGVKGRGVETHRSASRGMVVDAGSGSARHRS